MRTVLVVVAVTPLHYADRREWTAATRARPRLARFAVPYWSVLVASTVYVGVLFLIAWWGDHRAANGPIFSVNSRFAAISYALTLAIYNTSWSFYGSVGRAAAVGYEFIPIYIGPTLLLIFAQPLYARVLKIAKAQNATSVSDFIAARYGKSQHVAAVVTLMALVGVLPYIALQLKAVGSSFDVLTARSDILPDTIPFWQSTSFAVAITMAVFTIVFGVRHIHAAEHHRGLMLAIAFESLIKLSAFIVVGLFIVYGMFEGIGDLFARAYMSPALRHLTTVDLTHAGWYSVTVISCICFFCLPQAFHVTAVENENAEHTRSAAWLYPAYLAMLSLFMVPIAIAGMTTFQGAVNPDTFVINLPIAAGADTISFIAFIGGFSAATGMVIVAVVSLSTMVCNDVVMPLLLRSRWLGVAGASRDIAKVLLMVRRVAVVVILLLAYMMHRALGPAYPLTEIGLISFVAVAQFGPAFFVGLYWQQASRMGALAGMMAGFAVWAYTLLLPSLTQFAPWLSGIVNDGLFGAAWLKPLALFGIARLDPVSHATLWSLSANLVVFVVVSLVARQSAVERIQATAFVSGTGMGQQGRASWRAVTCLSDLRDVAARFVGQERADAAFASHLASTGHGGGIDPLRDKWTPADLDTVRFTENLIAGSIGAASARIVMAAALESGSLSRGAAMAMLDDATEALRFNRKLLQATLENVGQGIFVIDDEFRIAAWNERLIELLDLPRDLLHVGTPLSQIIEFNTARGEYGAEDLQALIVNRDLAAQSWPYVYERQRPDGAVLEITYTRLPEGGYVSTFKDVTERHRAAQALRDANETLERRVEERTEALAQAKAEAERANAHKTRFLAAASHDLMQPLTAARLFVSALEEKLRNGSAAPAPGSVNGHTDGTAAWALADNAATALRFAEQLLDGLMDMSSLDTGVVHPNIQEFPIDMLLSQLRVEFCALALEHGLTLRVVPSCHYVRSDPQLLRRVLQNYLSNAIRYTPKGRILLGCRRRGRTLRIFVCDTGVGIPEEKQAEVFLEFQRLEAGAQRTDRGLGLGLAIVERIAGLLGHEISLKSRVEHGTSIGIDVPIVPKPAAERLTPRAAPLRVQDAGRQLILCIDNETAIQQGLAAVLGQWGHRVVTAHDASAALTALDGQVPDLVLADYHLDGTLTGIAALDELRAAWGRLPDALIVTADRSAEVLEEAERRDCQVLYKPVKPASLRRFLTVAALRKARVAGSEDLRSNGVDA